MKYIITERQRKILKSYLTEMKNFDQKRIDDILDKISNVGYDNLSKSDKIYLSNTFDEKKENNKPNNNMSSTDLKEKRKLLNNLSYEVLVYPPDFPELDWDEDIKFWIEVQDKDGCLYDGGDLIYYLKNDLPKGMYEEIDGLFTYKGNLTKDKLISILDRIFN